MARAVALAVLEAVLCAVLLAVLWAVLEAVLWAVWWAFVLAFDAALVVFLLAVADAFFLTAVVEALRVTLATARLVAGPDFFAAWAWRLVVVVPHDTGSHPPQSALHCALIRV